MREDIFVKGARVHNLKNIDVSIPRDKLVVFTGLSGSGKSSLAFDTIFAEGQRRYIESLSSYARQFLGQMDKPDVDYIDGLSPAISIDQKTTSNNPRSTVGTVTEIYDYLRLLYARVGEVHCPKCGKKIEQQTVDQIADRIRSLESDRRVYTQALIREQSAWNALRDPRNLDEAVRARGLKLSFPAPEAVVHVSPNGTMRASHALRTAVAEARARRLNGEPDAVATASARRR